MVSAQEPSPAKTEEGPKKEDAVKQPDEGGGRGDDDWIQCTVELNEACVPVAVTNANKKIMKDLGLATLTRADAGALKDCLIGKGAWDKKRGFKMGDDAASSLQALKECKEQLMAEKGAKATVEYSVDNPGIFDGEEAWKGKEGCKKIVEILANNGSAVIIGGGHAYQVVSAQVDDDICKMTLRDPNHPNSPLGATIDEDGDAEVEHPLTPGETVEFDVDAVITETASKA